jgi:hydroxymethylbilane synthase
VGQAALGIEIRSKDTEISKVCAALDDYETHQCVTAERAFLHAMGGGCLSPWRRSAMFAAPSFGSGRYRSEQPGRGVVSKGRPAKRNRTGRTSG